MASKDSLINCRLRRLRGLSVRNITLDSDVDLPFAVFFALSLPESDGFGYFYRSHDEWNSLHPNWRYLDLSACSHMQQSTKDFFISLFVRCGADEPGPCRLLREWRIHVSGLLCVGSEMPPTNALSNGEDLLVLQFGELFYTTYQAEENPLPRPAASSDPDFEKPFDFNFLVRSDESYVRASYSLSGLHRMLRLTEERMRTEEQLRQQEDLCLTAIADTQAFRDQRTALEERRMQLRTVRQQVARMREKMAVRSAKMKELQNSNADRQKRKQELSERLELKSNNLRVAVNVYKRLRQDLNEYRIQIVSRRLELAKGLPFIFPILPSADNPNLLSIVHLPLPNSNEELPSSNLADNHLSAAYGFAGHLLQLLSVLADVPLRYPLEVLRARPHIRDNIVCQLDEAERSFPLYLRNRPKSERIRFKYAVFLLNRNVCLLRLNCGFDFKNLAATLFNLRELTQSALTPICSAEVLRAAEKLNRQMDEVKSTPTSQQSQERPQQEPERQQQQREQQSCAGNVSDIFFQGDAVDLAT